MNKVCIAENSTGNSLICEGAISAKQYNLVLEQHMLWPKHQVFPGKA